MLGHIQRGGTPTAFDRWLATRFGLQAIDAVADGDFGTMMALRGTQIVRLPLIEGTGELKLVEPERVRRGAGLLRLKPRRLRAGGGFTADPDGARVSRRRSRHRPEGDQVSSTATESEAPELKRVMGPRLLLLFIVGDILGAGVYAVTGEMALEVGGIVWVPFLVAFFVATLTAYSYLELVTKYPQAAGAALYTHKAFGVHFVTFLVAFAVVCSGITSASTSSNLLATNLLTGLDGIGVDIAQGDTAITVTAMLFMLVLAAINLRGVGESVKFNVVLTLIEMLALVIVIVIGFVVMARGDGDLGRIVVFESGSDEGSSSP